MVASCDESRDQQCRTTELLLKNFSDLRRTVNTEEHMFIRLRDRSRLAGEALVLEPVRTNQ